MATIVGLAEIEDADHVRMLQLRGELRFAMEAREHFAIVDEVLVQHLDRDVPIQTLVAAAVDAAHRARTDQLLDDVSTEHDLTDERVGHRRSLRDAARPRYGNSHSSTLRGRPMNAV